MDRDFLFPVQISAIHLDDAWHRAIRACFQFGHEYVVEHGSYEGQKRYELDFASILVKRPWEQIIPLMPEGISIPPPASHEQIEKYLADYLYSDALSEREDYRYGERLVAPKYRKISRPDLGKRHEQVEPPRAMGVNQVEEVVRIYREAGFGTNQCTMEIAMPNDILLLDPPCCRLIDTRIRYGRLHFVIYFRSWDLYAGFPVNLGGMELLKQMMASDIGVENGSMVVASKGLHIYEQYYELVECQTQLSLSQLRVEGEEKARKLDL
ncbi:MAG: thymidylate synthase [Planctomycetota bacterium]|jgi:thymidylate synthase